MSTLALGEALKLFIEHNPRITDVKTVAHYRRAVHEFGEHLGRPATTADLTDDAVSGFLRYILSTGRSPVTANHRRKCLNCLWTWLARRRIVESFPTVAKLKEPKRTPRAWTEGDLRKLIHACRSSDGIIGGVWAASYWLAFHALAWDTAARTSELLAMEWAWLDFVTGILTVPPEARKGKQKDAVYQLQPDTIAALRKIVTPHPLMFFGLTRSNFYLEYEKLLRRAGLPFDRYCKPQKLRRSHASWLKKAGGDPVASLQHSSDQVCRASYYDPTIIAESPASLLFRILREPEEDTTNIISADNADNAGEPAEANERQSLLAELERPSKPAPVPKVEVEIPPEPPPKPPVKFVEPASISIPLNAVDSFALWPGRLLTLPEVAELLKLPVENIHELVARKELPAVRVCGQSRIPHDAVETWLVGHMRSGGTNEPTDPAFTTVAEYLEFTLPRGDCTKRTLDDYTFASNKLRRYLGRETRLVDLTEANIEALAVWLAPSLSARSIQNVRKSLRSLMHRTKNGGNPLPHGRPPNAGNGGAA